jgi:hypothetical protein
MAETPQPPNGAVLPVDKDAMERLREWANRVVKNMSDVGVVFDADSIRRTLGLLRVCKACGEPIRIQIFKGEDWCSDDCRKKLQKEA